MEGTLKIFLIMLFVITVMMSPFLIPSALNVSCRDGCFTEGETYYDSLFENTLRYICYFPEYWGSSCKIKLGIFVRR